MGFKAKTQNKIKRDREKRARKAARQAQYQKWAEMGQNSKSKRFAKKSKSKKCTTVSHPEGRCGNVGCKQCFGINFNVFLHRGQPRNMPHKLWLRYMELKNEKVR